MVRKNKNILTYKITYTILILLVYFVGKSIPLYMIDISAYSYGDVSADSLLMQTLSGDIYQCSMFALGISPYMISTMVVQMISSFRKSESKSKISPKKTNYEILFLTLCISIIQSVLRVQELQFRVVGNELQVAKMIAMFEMMAGVMIILWLSSRNKRFGIGGQSALIFVNVIDGILATLQGHKIHNLIVSLVISAMVIIVIVIMENAEMRIPVQRISIHNIYADKNYLAIKLNPIGVMPAMFATAAFMVPQLLINSISWLLPEQAIVVWLKENITLSKYPGIGVYIVILYALTIGFSRVFVNPKDMTEQFLKSGDSILNLHAGRDTRKYLSKVINRISFFSATIMSICLGTPMVMLLLWGGDSTLVTLPSSVMMLTGIWCNIYREIVAIRDLDAYTFFI